MISIAREFCPSNKQFVTVIYGPLIILHASCISQAITQEVAMKKIDSKSSRISPLSLLHGAMAQRKRSHIFQCNIKIHLDYVPSCQPALNEQECIFRPGKYEAVRNSWFDSLDTVQFKKIWHLSLKLVYSL